MHFIPKNFFSYSPSPEIAAASATSATGYGGLDSWNAAAGRGLRKRRSLKPFSKLFTQGHCRKMPP